jgi:hypothetical protein
VGKEKYKSTCFGIFFTKIAHHQVMNFIPAKVSTLYKTHKTGLLRFKNTIKIL